LEFSDVRGHPSSVGRRSEAATGRWREESYTVDPSEDLDCVLSYLLFEYATHIPVFEPAGKEVGTGSARDRSEVFLTEAYLSGADLRGTLVRGAVLEDSPLNFPPSQLHLYVAYLTARSGHIAENSSPIHRCLLAY
jgi:hypothetical protein